MTQNIEQHSTDYVNEHVNTVHINEVNISVFALLYQWT